MDVELLRPGTVPISPDTSLWFEFILHPDLLVKHLNNPSADPTATELVSKFITISQNEKCVDLTGELNGLNSMKISRRSLALKVLALKVVSFLKWDPDVIEKKFSPGIQITLLRDLISLSSPSHSDVSCHESMNLEELKPHELFSVSYFHRWVLRTYMNNGLEGKANNKPPSLLLPPEPPFEEVQESDAERSYEVLRKLTQSTNLNSVSIPNYDTWIPLREEGPDEDHNWGAGIVVSNDEFLCQIFMDMSSYLLYKEKYSDAKPCLQKCLDYYEKWKKEGLKASIPYCHVTENIISGYCTAMNIKQAPYTASLVQQFHNSLVDQYAGIIKILERDNTHREISILFRENLELDIGSEVASGKVTAFRDGVVQIQALNLVRRAVEGGSWHKPKLPPVSINYAITSLLPTLSQVQKKNLKYFLLEMLASSDSVFVRKMCEQPAISQLITDDELHQVTDSSYTDPIPQVLQPPDTECLPPPKNRILELSACERQIIGSYDILEIKNALAKLVKASSNFTINELNRYWDVSRYRKWTEPLGPKIQPYILILFCKASELKQRKNFQAARIMLRSICDAVKNRTDDSRTIRMIERFVNEDLLSVDVAQFHAEWPAKNMDWNDLSERCLGFLQSKVVLPLREECVLTLLNMGHWQQIVSCPSLLENDEAVIEIYVLIAGACLDSNKFSKKAFLKVWDKFLPTFLGHHKRRQGGYSTTPLTALYEHYALAIVLSLMAKVHNILMDQGHLDLYVHLTPLWPDAMKDTHQYNVKIVSEMLMEVLDHTITLYPTSVGWLRLKGDLHFVNGNYAAALKSYIETGIAGTENFARPLLKNFFDDIVLKRMIKSCTYLQCYTQAGVLCQFLDDVDYTTAYKCLSEVATCDAMDIYYECIWDINILEFLISLHTKRGEHYRKQKAIRIIGKLELNSNNNDEIRRESENIRKARFMRALARQFVSS